MHWLFLLLSLGALYVAWSTAYTWLMLLCLLASGGLFVAWLMRWYNERVGSTRRDESQMIDPVELRRLRELAEARKAAKSDADSTSSS